MIDFLLALASNMLGGLVVAGAAYFVIERRLRLRQERQQRIEISKDLLATIGEELERNRAVAAALREHLPAGGLPYDAFETDGWTLLSQVPAFTSLDPATLKDLLDVYLRLRSANGQHSLLFDLMYGSTGTVAYVIASGGTSAERRAGWEGVEQRRADLRQRLLRRVEELEPYLEQAIERVRPELGRG